MAKVEIRSQGPPHSTEILIDGRAVPGVRAYMLGQSIDSGLPLLRMDIVCTELRAHVADATVEAQPAALPVVKREILHLDSSGAESRETQFDTWAAEESGA